MYRRKFKMEEAFLPQHILKAVQLTCKVIGNRSGLKVSPSTLPIDFANKEGKFSGLICFVSNGMMMRFNWKLGSSADIISVDFWNTLKNGFKSPDLTMKTEGLNIVKLVDVLVSVLKKEGEYSFTLEESVLQEKGEVKARPKNIASIKQWAIDMDIDDGKLERQRVADLYRDYEYWYKEYSDAKTAFVSPQVFRNIIIQFLDNRGLKNIYMRSIKVRSGNKEQIITTDNASESAYQSVAHLQMSVDDLRSFMNDSLRAVARGYQNSLIIAGRAGVGKTTGANAVLKEEGMKIFNMNGSIRNLKILYGIFYNNNDPKTVIIFDDTPDMFNKSFMGIINAALDDKPVRILSFPQEIGKDIKKFKPELEFKGKVVILTNTPKAKIPKAMTSRSITIEVEASNQQIIDDIRKNLLDVLPEVKLAVKEEVLNYIQDLGKNINSIDYRQFKLALVFKLTGSPDWKKKVFTLLK